MDVVAARSTLDVRNLLGYMSQQTHRKTFFLVWSEFVSVVFSTLKCGILFAQRKISGLVFENVFKLTLIKSMSGGIYNSHVQVAPADRSELSRACQSLSFSFVIGISPLTSAIDWGLGQRCRLEGVGALVQRHLLMTSAMLKESPSDSSESLQPRARPKFAFSLF